MICPSLPHCILFLLSFFLHLPSPSHPHPSSLLPTTLHQMKSSFVMLLYTYFSALSDRIGSASSAVLVLAVYGHRTALDRSSANFALFLQILTTFLLTSFSVVWQRNQRVMISCLLSTICFIISKKETSIIDLVFCMISGSSLNFIECKITWVAPLILTLDNMSSTAHSNSSLGRS